MPSVWLLRIIGKSYRGQTAHQWSHMQAADVWSCGVMLYVMLSAQYPFGRPEDTHLKTARQMHVMLQVSAVLSKQTHHCACIWLKNWRLRRTADWGSTV